MTPATPTPEPTALAGGAGAASPQQPDGGTVTISALVSSLTTIIGSITPETPADDVVAVHTLLGALKERVRELDAMFRDGPFKEWLEAHGGRELEIGDKRFFVGPVKKEKCRDVAQACECFITMASDLAEFATLLAADAFKPGAARKFLAAREVPDTFEELFAVTYELDVQTGKPRKKVQEINTAFVAR